MSVVVVGLHERDAPLELLERVAISSKDLPKALAVLCDSPHLAEAVVLSTCMRTEVYAVLERFHDGLIDIESFFAARAGTGEGSTELADRLVVSYDDAAAQHLFEVAAGVDSAVLGEGEILRQVRHAGEVARREKASGPLLGGLFRHALTVGKRARSETAIARGITSLAHVAVALAAEHYGGSLVDRRLVVVGAGEMGEGIAAAAGARGPAELVVANRSVRRAAQLAERVGGRAIALSEIETALEDADVLLTATTADEVLLEAEDVRAVVARRGERPLLIVDAAVPRDVDPAVGDVEGVRLFDLVDLRSYAEREMRARRDEVARVEEIVADELERYRTYARGRAVTPLVAALRTRAEETRLAELERVRVRLGQLDPADRALVDQLSRRLVAKLIHEPTAQVKAASGSARGERLAETLRILYDL